MSMEQEKSWSAYLDGELSTPEAAAFEASLPERGFRRLEAEVKLEAGIADALGTDTCPDPVWDRTRELLQTQMKSKQRQIVPWRVRVLALAAVAIMCAGAAWVYSDYYATPSFMVVPASSSELEARNESGPVWENAETFMHEHGVQLALRPLEADKLDLHKRIEFIGAAHVKYRGEQVVELFFDCCYHPIVLTVAPKDSKAASMITGSVGCGTVQGTQVIGDYVVAVVSRHRAYGLMNVFAEI